jgi:hypothetical protein
MKTKGGCEEREVQSQKFKFEPGKKKIGRGQRV